LGCQCTVVPWHGTGTIPGYNEVVTVTHTTNSFDDLRLIILYDFDSLEVLEDGRVRRPESLDEMSEATHNAE